MNAEEAATLCRLAKTISPSQPVDEFTPAAWALILEDVRFVDARQALKELGGEQEWLHVSHIVKRVKRIRAKRVEDFGALPEPPAGHDPDNTAAHARWLAKVTEQIADGEMTERPEATDLVRRKVRELDGPKRVNLLDDADRARYADALRDQRKAALAELAAKPEPEPAPPPVFACEHRDGDEVCGAEARQVSADGRRPVCDGHTEETTEGAVA